MFSRAARITFSLAAARKPIWNLVVSNVPGPQFPLYMAGAQLVANYPVSVITDGMGLNITVMSYCGHLDFGIVADRDQIPDVWKLIEWLEESLVRAAPPGRGAQAAPAAACSGEEQSTGRAPAPRRVEELLREPLPGLRAATVGAIDRGRDRASN